MIVGVALLHLTGKGQRDTLQVVASTQRTETHLDDTLRNHDFRQILAVVEGVGGYDLRFATNVIGILVRINGNQVEIIIGVGAKIIDIIVHIKLQTGTAGEHIIANVLDIIRQDYLAQPDFVLKGQVRNAGDGHFQVAIRNGDLHRRRGDKIHHCPALSVRIDLQHQTVIQILFVTYRHIVHDAAGGIFFLRLCGRCLHLWCNGLCLRLSRLALQGLQLFCDGIQRHLGHKHQKCQKCR